LSFKFTDSATNAQPPTFTSVREGFFQARKSESDVPQSPARAPLAAVPTIIQSVGAADISW